MTHTGWLWGFVTWMSLPTLLLLAGILVRQKVHREFPLFFWLLAGTVIAGLLRFLAGFAPFKAYYYVYWASDLVINILAFLAVYELFIRRLFRGFHKIWFYRVLFPAAGSCVVVLAWLTAFAAPDRTAAFLFQDRILNSVLVAVLFFFVSLMVVMGRIWTRYDFGIAFGLGINAAAFLIASSVMVRRHYQQTLLGELPLFAADISCVLWLLAFCIPEKRMESVPAENLGPEALHEARSWETMLKSWLVPGKNKR